MGEKDFTFNGMVWMVDQDTGEKICETNNVKEITIDRESEHIIDLDITGRNNVIATFNHSPTLEFTMDNIITDVNLDTSLYGLFGYDLSNTPNGYTIQFPFVKQRRIHKKKRINKKWLKRYGYETKYIETKGWKMNNHGGGTVEFVKN